MNKVNTLLGVNFYSNLLEECTGINQVLRHRLELKLTHFENISNPRYSQFRVTYKVKQGLYYDRRHKKDSKLKQEIFLEDSITVKEKSVKGTANLQDLH